jgi:hypothetical protein
MSGNRARADGPLTISDEQTLRHAVEGLIRPREGAGCGGPGATRVVKRRRQREYLDLVTAFQDRHQIEVNDLRVESDRWVRESVDPARTCGFAERLRMGGTGLEPVTSCL